MPADKSLPDDLLRIADSNSDLTDPERATLRLAAQALRWVPVVERLPEPDRYVTCRHEHHFGRPWIGWRSGATGNWYGSPDASQTVPTHWLQHPESQ